MKKLILSLFQLFIFAAVLAQTNSSSIYSQMRGRIDAGVYHNDFFNLQYPLPAGWETAPERNQASFLDALMEGRTTHVYLQLMIYRPVETVPIPDVIVMMCEPFQRKGLSDIDATKDFYRVSNQHSPGSQVIRNPEIVTFGASKLLRQDVYSSGAKQYMAEFALVIKDQLLHIQIHSGSKERMNVIADGLTQTMKFGQEVDTRKKATSRDGLH